MGTRTLKRDEMILQWINDQLTLELSPGNLWHRVTDVCVWSSSDLVYIRIYVYILLSIIYRCVYHIRYNVQQFSEWALKTHNGWCFQLVFLFNPNLVPRPQLVATSNVVGGSLNITQSSWLVCAIQNDHNLGCLIAHVSSHCGRYKTKHHDCRLFFSHGSRVATGKRCRREPGCDSRFVQRYGCWYWEFY